MPNNLRPIVLVASMATVLLMLFFAMDIAAAGYYDTVLLADCAKKGADDANIECFSFFATDNGKGDCAINDKDDPPAVVGICDSNPCHFTAECTPSADGKDFTCNCPPPMTGKTCEDLACDDLCFRMGTLVVYTQVTNSMTWLDSYDYCTSKGLLMFMDKSWTTHGFVYGIVNQLTNNPYATFWIGLNRTTANDPFIYADGTELTADSFTDWAPDYPKVSSYVSLAGGKLFYRWKDQTNDKGGNYFPLCQATYDFLSYY